jgi:3'(2'), 5'-bisphosphate nucleotidase
MTDTTLHALTLLCRQAAKAILEVRQQAMQNPQAKQDTSPVTLADLRADAVIRAGLANGIAAPGDHVLTEETWQEGAMPTRGRVWVVDPLDGTEDFVAGRPDYAVQIGLIKDGVPLYGVVCQPATGLVWRGHHTGDPATSRCERVEPDDTVHPLRLPESGPLPGPPRIAVSVSHPSAVVDAVVAGLGGVGVPMGSVGLKIGAIVDGRVDAYVTGSRHIKVWDTGGPAAILLAAGGAVTSLAQRPLCFTGAVAHDDGVCAWSMPARAALLDGLRLAISHYRDAVDATGQNR